MRQRADVCGRRRILYCSLSSILLLLLFLGANAQDYEPDDSRRQRSGNLVVQPRPTVSLFHKHRVWWHDLLRNLFVPTSRNHRDTETWQPSQQKEHWRPKHKQQVQNSKSVDPSGLDLYYDADRRRVAVSA